MFHILLHVVIKPLILVLGDYAGGIPLPECLPLEKRETTLENEREDREAFLRLMKKMLQWDPDKRSSAKELIEDEWIQMYTCV